MQLKNKSHHVVRNADDGWNVKANNAKRSSGHFQTKKEAVDAGRKISSNQGKWSRTILAEWLLRRECERRAPRQYFTKTD